MNALAPRTGGLLRLLPVRQTADRRSPSFPSPPRGEPREGDSRGGGDSSLTIIPRWAWSPQSIAAAHQRPRRRAPRATTHPGAGRRSCRRSRPFNSGRRGAGRGGEPSGEARRERAAGARDKPPEHLNTAAASTLSAAFDRFPSTDRRGAVGARSVLRTGAIALSGQQTNRRSCSPMTGGKPKTRNRLQKTAVKGAICEMFGAEHVEKTNSATSRHIPNANIRPSFSSPPLFGNSSLGAIADRAATGDEARRVGAQRHGTAHSRPRSSRGPLHAILPRTWDTPPTRTPAPPPTPVRAPEREFDARPLHHGVPTPTSLGHINKLISGLGVLMFRLRGVKGNNACASHSTGLKRRRPR
ncbi:Protein of unknown function [Gryllus bimaculatus]|nr:Protein of unknown function [Gryllus bimaculatus]